MAWFKYKLFTPDGRELEGLIEAQTADAAADILEQRYTDEKNSTVFVAPATGMDGLLGE
jgi:type II secretory pathway component PulF